MEIIKLLLDTAMIALLGAAVYYALRLEKQLRVLRESRSEMAHYIADFTRNVDRAESGIKSLKLMARESGDDLEKLVDRAQALRDELQFMVDHADSLAEKITRLGSHLAQQQTRVPDKDAPMTSPAAAPAERAPLRAVMGAVTAEKGAPEPRSRAERELLQALQKMQDRGN